MAEAGIGYNISKVNSVMEDISTKLNDLYNQIVDNWDTQVEQVLDQNWVGEDENAYKITLANDLNELFRACKETTQNTIDFVFEAAGAWHGWQKQQSLSIGTDGAYTGAGMTDYTGLEKPSISLELHISPTESALLNDITQQRGLISVSSVTTITGNVGDYIKNVGDKANAFADVSYLGAFVGESQDTKFQELTTQVGKCIQEMYDHFKTTTETVLENLTQTAYKSAAADTTSAVETAKTTVEGSDVSTTSSVIQ